MSKSIARHLDEVLARHGFTRREESWNRVSSGFVDVISVQIKGGDVTVEAGVLYPVAYERCLRQPVPELVAAQHCTVRARAGQVESERTIWWRQDQPGLGLTIVGQVESELLPFIDSNHSVSAMASTLGKSRNVRNRMVPEVLYLAVLRQELGDVAGACELLEPTTLQQKSAWGQTFEILRQQLSCGSRTPISGRR